MDTSSEVSPVSPSSSPAGVVAKQRRPRSRLLVASLILACGVVAFFVLHPLESSLNRALEDLKLSGDVRREWEALQQFGQGVSITIIMLIVLLMERTHQRRLKLVDFGLALAAIGAVVTAMKWFIGRPRPKFGDPDTFLFPWGTYPMKAADGTVIQAHAWDLTVPNHAQLWSMPSSHTAFAVVTAVFLAVMYPRLRWLAAVLATIVAAGRLVFDAHWMTDVTTGAAVALAVGWPIVTGAALSRRITRAMGLQPL